MKALVKKIFGTTEDRDLKKLMKRIESINILEPEMMKLTDEELQMKTAEFKVRVENGESLDSILPEAFAVVREGAKRVLDMRHYDVQLVGGIVLHEGKIAEMKTGEGKTLVSTLPSYLNALTGQGVHIVTVNEYLASRDAEEMGELHHFLGLTVGLNVSGMSPEQKRAAYESDITYGTNNEFGFDYLRDNMVLYSENKVQRTLGFSIVDEVDSNLVDEARTPLIISGQAQRSTELYHVAARFIKMLKNESHFSIDEKVKAIALTDDGVTRIEETFKISNLYDAEHVILNHHIQNALRAEHIMKRDVDYVIVEGEVIIVDEFTGRLMQGRRYSDGLHQAIEAKEELQVQNESMTLATITLQNYFRMYTKLSGMTGTAKTEEEEFKRIYGMEVVVIPTNKPIVRLDLPDMIYKSEAAKYNAVVEEIAERHQTGQPILVGTTSIEKSEMIAELLKRRGVAHTILNAKQHEKEADIVGSAGQKGSVTIATNMAGRGTDIKLGEGVSDRGGLHILGTERHESRRIDNQLRGRAGRQGDPGSSQFFLSLQDELMRRFGSENIMGMMDKLGMEEDTPLESRMVSRAIESAQKRVEGNNFDVRRVVLQYDDVMNQQRSVIYKQRNEVLSSDNLQDIVMNMVLSHANRVLEMFCSSSQLPEEWDLGTLIEHVNATFLNEGLLTENDVKGLEIEEIREKLEAAIRELYIEREEMMGSESMREFEKVILLRSVDGKWLDHIDSMDHLRQGIHLRAYAQTDPLQEYQFEGFEMFNKMIIQIEEEVATYIMKTDVQPDTTLEREAVVEGKAINTKDGEEEVKTIRRDGEKVGRNEPCPCGSGKKLKNCHGE